MEKTLEIPPSAPPHLRMTEEEFEAWCDEDVKAEWVHGEVIVHSPAAYIHVSIASFLIQVVGLFVQHHKIGIVVGPEFQIRMPGLRRVPDLLFIAEPRRNIIKRTFVEGAPDLVMEIVSPDSVERDYREKHLEYEAAGVREYWLFDPQWQRTQVHALNNAGKYARIAESAGVIHSTVLPGFWLRTAWLWQDPLPNTLDVLRELGVL
ncbi:MAG: Uma2 family endonuclease [Chloroflexi bacterium]|nr:Uma2 family endonuclease [Chloroflexota bacterium]